MYLVIILIPPLYFAFREKWGAFILNGLLYLIALFTIILGVGVIFWVLAVGHAGWHLRKEIMAEHAEMIATKMVERMRSDTAQ